MPLNSCSFEFGDFRLSTDERVLFLHEKPVPITPKMLQLLFVLVENHGHIVEKADLMESVWAGSCVEDSNLTFTIRQLRKVLGDDRSDPKFIRTVPRRGYRFIADVRELPQNGKGTTPEKTKDPDPPGPPNFPIRSPFPRNYLFGVLLTGALLAAALFLYSWYPSDKSVRGETLPLRFEALAHSSTPVVAISPDGKYISFTLTTNGGQALWLRELSTRTNTRIVSAEDDVYFRSVKFSPDSGSVYFLRSYKGGPGHLDHVSLTGDLLESDILSGIESEFSIAPDGSRFSYYRRDGSKRFLLTAGRDGSSPQTVFESTGLITDNAFSPDGKSIAFASGQSDTGDRNFGVFIVDPQTGTVKPVSDFRWFYIRAIVWLPDQSGILVTGRTKNDEIQQVWKIAIPSGDVRQVTQSQNSLDVMSGTSDLSRLVFSITTQSADLYVGSMSGAGQDRLITRSSTGVAWTGNGELVSVSRSTGKNDIWLLDPGSGSERQLTSDDSNEANAAVSPDGRNIVFVSDRAGRNNLWRMNVDGSGVVQLTNGDGEQAPVFTTDGRFVLYDLMTDRSLWKIPIDGGNSLRVTAGPAFMVAVSPDGSRFAHFGRQNGKVKLFVKTFKEPERADEFDIPDGYSLSTERVAWTRDGRSVIFSVENAGLVANLWRQDLETRKCERLTNYESNEIFQFAISLHGSQYAINRGVWNHDIVLATGFDAQ